ncbi:RNA polymerase sigma factor SigJ [Sessilibacter corallicola]|uniref:RNA polymerase sigma factor SigJ n=1 Tax=Sessilibacter corallicola TaxID=2904075 RepID=UPI001E39BF6D|nr:RNA polymerase sigma factor SigJ [Sessilibacter corallicola]MCE2030287.1 RNA polymerase sigma factor SigJ [Sessilibacter corallicola]
MNEKTQVFEQHRNTLEGLAYRMLGSLSEAQDAVQETYLKWHQQNLDSVTNQRAWLVTVCTRICLNQLKLAYKQREVYTGEWLPEPILHCDGNNTDAQLDRDETLTIALLHVLEKLTPVERAVFILREVFELDFSEIAAIVDKTSANCRQLAVRSRKHVQSLRPRFSATEQEHQALIDQFIKAAQSCDINGLISVLKKDVELYSDGGGKVEALPAVLRGRQSVAEFFVRVFRDYQRESTALNIKFTRFNEALGLLIFEHGNLTTALTVECESDCICRIFAVRNPSKLNHKALENSSLGTSNFQ